VSDAGFWRYVARPAAVEQVAAAGSTRLPEPAADFSQIQRAIGGYTSRPAVRAAVS
jgi:hypothetical protein